MKEREVLIWWIDDDREHVEEAINLEKSNENLKVTFMEPKDVTAGLKSLSVEDVPDLFLVDYFLNRRGKEKYQNQGLTMEGTIRENYPEHPVYGFTVAMEGEEKELRKIFSEIKQAAEERFDKILNFKDVQRKGNDIYKDALDHRRIRESERGSLKELFQLIKAPEDVKERLKMILPDELHEGLATKGDMEKPEGNAIAFARWVRESLMTKPGFLYNRLYTATHLGMTEEAFEGISGKFGDTKYNGVFHETEPLLWWVCRIDEILFSQDKAKDIENTKPLEVAPEVFEIPEGQRTKCAVCGEKYPETVGLNLDDEEEQSVHYKCSTVNRDKRGELYFDEPRCFVIKSDD